MSPEVQRLTELRNAARSEVQLIQAKANSLAGRAKVRKLSDEEIERLIRKSVGAKWEGHEINSAKFMQPDRPMYAIGG